MSYRFHMAGIFPPIAKKPFSCCFLSACFGILTGYFAARLFSCSSDELTLLFSSTLFDGGGFLFCFFQTLFLYFRMPLFAVLLSCDGLGRRLLPLLLLGQGFTLSYCLFTFSHFGDGAFWLTLTLMGSRFAFLLPITLYLAAVSFQTVFQSPIRGRSFAFAPLTLFGCAAVLCFGAMLESALAVYVLPLLLDGYPVI